MSDYRAARKSLEDTVGALQEAAENGAVDGGSVAIASLIGIVAGVLMNIDERLAEIKKEIQGSRP